MFAKVLDVNDQLIYLEIDHQLRFKSRYVLDRRGCAVCRQSKVEFDFSHNNGTPLVVIHTSNGSMGENPTA